MLYIGIDLGTSAVKLLLMNEAGEILHVVSRDYPLEFPRPGWSQQNPADWQKAVWEGIPLLLEGFDGSQVAGIGAGGQMHGLVVLDEEDRVIRPAILWNDGRTAQAGYRLERDRGQGPALPMDGQHRLCRLHGSEASVDAGAGAGAVCQNQKGDASQGLHQSTS